MCSEIERGEKRRDRREIEGGVWVLGTRVSIGAGTGRVSNVSK